MGHTLSPDKREAAARSDQLHGDGLNPHDDASNVRVIVADPSDGRVHDLGNDKFRPVPGFEGLYEVSRDGRVRSLDRIVDTRDGTTKRLRGVDLIVSDGGVSLSRDGRRRGFSVRRLVRAAFPEAVAR